jgi:hypothetical protein
MNNYIIVTRVLNPMSDKANDLWKHHSSALSDKYLKIVESNIFLVDGEKLDKQIWGGILTTKCKELQTEDKEHIRKWQEEIIENKDMKTVIFVHFGGYNEEDVKAPLNKLMSCFDKAKVNIIPFTVQSTSGGILESANFLDIKDKGVLEAELKNTVDNYVARKGVFGWFLEYEDLVFKSENFKSDWETFKQKERDKSANNYEDYEKTEQKFRKLKSNFQINEYVNRINPENQANHTKTIFKLFKSKFNDNKEEFNDSNNHVRKLKFKIGTWDSKYNCPKAAKANEFTQFRKKLATIYDENLIVNPREEVFDAWLIVHTLRSLQKTTHGSSIDDADSWFIKDPKPVLSVGLLTLWDSPFSKKTNCEAFRKEYLDARVRFWDSCVWFRYVPLLGESWTIFQRHTFENAINDIYTYHINGTYRTISSREFLEFHLRVYKNAFVAGVANNVTRAHGGSVMPFSFHSETKIQQEIMEIMKDLKDLKWRILLVDDVSKTSLRTVDGKLSLTKQEFIIEALKNKDLVELECVTEFEAAYDSIENPNTHYDIILLDYLFQKDGVNKFGIDFLKNLLKRKNEGDTDYLKEQYLGPLNKHWIVPISVYQNALTDNLHDSAIMTHGAKWLITQGTDPLNKPHLFRYILLRLMKKQFKEAFFAKDLLAGYEENDAKKMMHNARKAYVKIIAKSNQLKGLIDFYQKSDFATSLVNTHFSFTKDEINPKDLVHIGEHLQHLFILLANGNTQYKPQMWEEYFWLKNRLMKNNKDFWNNIEKYIEGIKG